MTIIVCPLQSLAIEVARSSPARIITLLAPGQAVPETPPGIPRLVLRFHDIVEPRDGLVAPSRDMVQALIAFGYDWVEPEPLLIHCWMGISRSPAAAFILACALNPKRSELDIAHSLRDASSSATPNPGLIAHADEILGRGGRLNAAVAAIGRGQHASVGEAFLLESVRQLP